MATFAEVNAQKKRNELSIQVYTNPSLAADIYEMQKSYDREKARDERLNRTPEAPKILKQIEKLRKEAEDSMVTFKFRDIGRRAFENLIDEYPPTDSQKEMGFRWNPEEFSPRLIQMTCIDPELSLEDALTIWNEWSFAEADAIVTAAISVCTERASVPFTVPGTRRSQNSA